MSQLPSTPDGEYRLRLLAEKDRYQDCLAVHDLPPIFHYWSNKHIRPRLEAFGFTDPHGMFDKYLRELQNRHCGEDLRFASIGAGNCELEISLARSLLWQGRSDFVIDCLELNPAMLERGKAAAVNAGVDRHIRLVETDVNSWKPDRGYHAVLANQSLHHILNLESLFDEIGACLEQDGVFIVSDMIGRNGHLRWPEALEIVQEFWRQLPPSYRVNQKLQRFEETYENWDCSTEDFEGIRSQDILPLLVSRFHFKLFIGFGNVIDPFVDRAFGPHFNVNAPWDRAFIDKVHQRDQREMHCGNVKPTHMLAVVGKRIEGPLEYFPPMEPAFCIRDVIGANSDTEPGPGGYDWHGQLQDTRRELELACRRLTAAEQRIRQLTEYADSQKHRLEGEIAEKTVWARRLDSELAERTEWAVCLVGEIAGITARSTEIEKTLAERTAWALALDRELAERTAWALQLSGEIEQLRSFKPSGPAGLDVWLSRYWRSAIAIRSAGARETSEQSRNSAAQQ